MFLCLVLIVHTIKDQLNAPPCGGTQHNLLNIGQFYCHETK